MTEEKNTSNTKLIVNAAIIIALLLFAYSTYKDYLQREGESASQANNIPTETVPAIPDHHYSIKDGYQYGYEQAISQNDTDAGKLANTLLMFRYSGMKNGKYQVYNTDDTLDVLSVLECEKPCEFVKISTHVSVLDQPKVEHMRLAPGTIAWSVFTDAMNGKLEPVVLEKNGKKSNIWITEKGELTQVQS